MIPRILYIISMIVSTPKEDIQYINMVFKYM